MPIRISDKALCVGCYACYSVCPVNCITMKPDSEGFLYPVTNMEQCILCEKCVSTCPQYKKILEHKTLPMCYAAIYNNEDVRLRSSSGGVFSALAQIILRKKGVVFGAAFTEDYGVVTVPVNSVEELKKLNGSKYLQSMIGDSFREAKECLEKDKWVLFSGTPCQIEGLNAFLSKTYEKLLTVDIICHGVPSPMVWQKYVDFEIERNNSEIKDVSFRDKSYGWKQFAIRIDFENGVRVLQSHNDNPYMRLFLENYSLRPSCYNCNYKVATRSADITLADFWGIESVFPELDDDRGTSLIIVRSEKGTQLIDAVSSECRFAVFEHERIKDYNSAYLKSSSCPRDRELFMRKIKKRSFAEANESLNRIIDKRNNRSVVKKRIIKKIKHFKYLIRRG